MKGLAEVGARVHVTGWQVADQIVATTITVLTSPAGGGGRLFNLRGHIEALPENGLLGTWTISGQQVQVTRQTRIHGEEQVRLGAPVEAGGLQYQNGIRLTTWLRVRDMSGPGPQPSMTPGASHTPSVTPRPMHTPSGTPQATGTPGDGPQPTHTPQPTRIPGDGPLSAAEIDALERAIDEEYLALNTYQAVLTQLGNVTPFTRIAPSEQQHVDALSALFVKYGLPAPGNPGLTPTPVFADLKAACQAGVDTEIADAALYDVLLPAVTDHTDLVQVFTNLRAVSLNSHLPAFDRCN